MLRRLYDWSVRSLAITVLVLLLGASQAAAKPTATSPASFAGALTWSG
jgi:hypothetical protein